MFASDHVAPADALEDECLPFSQVQVAAHKPEFRLKKGLARIRVQVGEAGLSSFQQGLACSPKNTEHIQILERLRNLSQTASKYTGSLHNIQDFQKGNRNAKICNKEIQKIEDYKKTSQLICKKI